MTRESLPDALYFRVFDVKRGKADEKRVRIIQATIDLIATKGFDATTFDAIGKAVKMKRTHVAYYFSSREELLMTAVRFAIALGQQTLVEHLEKATGWRERLTAILEGPFEWLERYPKHAPVITVFYHLCYSNPTYRALQNEIRNGGEERIVAALQTPIETGQLTRKKAVDFARSAQSLLTGSLINQSSSDYPLDLPSLKKLVLRHAFLLLEAELVRS